MNRANARKLLSSYLEAPTVRLSVKIGLSPNAVTLFGLVIAGASAYLASTGYLLASGVTLLASGAFDLVDGALARATGRVTKFGALLDSVVDRVSEAIVLLGILIYYLDGASTLGAVLVYVALAGSIMVSYVRSRAEGLGIDCKVGVMTRPERVAVLGIALMVGQWWEVALTVALGAIAVLTSVTTAQRVLHVRRELKSRDAAGG